ncbi:hypothetical protein GCM10027273_04520 [Nocardioides pakistanensis]
MPVESSTGARRPIAAYSPPRKNSSSATPLTTVTSAITGSEPYSAWSSTASTLERSGGICATISPPTVNTATAASPIRIGSSTGRRHRPTVDPADPADPAARDASNGSATPGGPTNRAGRPAPQSAGTRPTCNGPEANAPTAQVAASAKVSV